MNQPELLKEVTYQRRESEAKRLAREHAHHAVAHLNAGNYDAAASQFTEAAAYTAKAEHARTNRRAILESEGWLRQVRWRQPSE